MAKKPDDEPSPSYSAHLSRRGQDVEAADGTFVIDDLITRAGHSVFVQAEGYATGHIERVVAMPMDDQGWPLEIRLEKGKTQSVEVKDVATQVAVQGVRIFSVGRSDNTSLNDIDSLLSGAAYDYRSNRDVVIQRGDPDGRCELHFAEAVTASTIVVLADGYAPHRIIQNPPSSGKLPVLLEPEARVTGTTAGLPGFNVAKAEIWLEMQGDQRHVTVSPDGSFEFGSLSAGRAVIRTNPGPTGSTMSSHMVDLATGVTHTVDLARDPKGAVTVRVNQDGAPLEGAQISLNTGGEDGFFLGSAVTDDKGEARFERLPSVKCLIQVLHQGMLKSQPIDLTDPTRPSTVQFDLKREK